MDIVPLTAEHFAQIEHRPPPVTVQGLAVLDGERVMGVAGIYPDHMMPRMVLVAKFAPAAYELLRAGRHYKTLLRAGRAVLAIAAERKLPVHSVADPSIPGSVNLLKHLGFKHFIKDTYACPGSQ